MRKPIVLFLLVAFNLVAAEKTPPPHPGWLGIGYTYHRDAGQQWLQLRIVVPRSPADVAGLAVGDVITKIDGKPLRFRDDFEMLEFLGRIRPAQRLVFTVVHQQTAKSVPVTAIEMTDDYFNRWKLNLEIARRNREERERPAR
ncbi:MAG TPA: PDZ domain-containing protein [Thermoanaerobaculia bacterium]|nr:PDZ domain-containing protein [Thermoanaerobaculia bacterium]